MQHSDGGGHVLFCRNFWQFEPVTTNPLYAALHSDKTGSCSSIVSWSCLTCTGLRMTHNGEKHCQEIGRTPTLLMTLMQLTNVLIQSREYRDAFAVSAETQTCQQSMLKLSPNPGKAHWKVFESLAARMHACDQSWKHGGTQRVWKKVSNGRKRSGPSA